MSLAHKTAYFSGISLLILHLLGFGWSVVHPIHLSITNIEHNAQAHTLEITHRFFVDDFEKKLEKEYKAKLNLGTPQEHPKADEWIQDFLKNNFSITVNGKTPKLTFIGKEIDAEAILIFVEIADVKKLKQIDVTHKTMLDVFQDQRNFVNIKYNGEKKAAILDAKKPHTVVIF